MTSWPHILILLRRWSQLVRSLSPFQQPPPHTTELALSAVLQSEAKPTLLQSSVHFPISQMGQTEAEKGHVGEQRSPVLAWFFGYSPRHPSRRFSTWGNDCRLLGWDLPEASVLSIGPHSLYPLPRVSNSKPFSLEELGLWPRLVTILSLKRFPHPKRCQSSILAEP